MEVNTPIPHRELVNERRDGAFGAELHSIECWCTWSQIYQSVRFTALLLRVSTSYEDRSVRMGTSDVEEWVFASTVAPGDSDDAETGGWDKDRVLTDWAEGLQIIRMNLSSSSTKNRVEFLEGLVMPLVKGESESPLPKLAAITRLKRSKV